MMNMFQLDLEKNYSKICPNCKKKMDIKKIAEKYVIYLCPRCMSEKKYNICPTCLGLYEGKNCVKCYKENVKWLK